VRYSKWSLGLGTRFLNALVADAAAGAEIATLTGVPEAR
jgi:hypothetical protein